MPGFILHVNMGMQCSHAAVASTTPVQTRVLVSGQPVAVTTNVIKVTLCPFQVPAGTGTKPQPCVTVKWANVSARVKVMGFPVLTQLAPGPGGGVCQSIEQIPQGPPVASAFQMRVFAQ